MQFWLLTGLLLQSLVIVSMYLITAKNLLLPMCGNVLRIYPITWTRPLCGNVLTLLIPGLLGAPQYRGGLIRPPLHNFSISYAFALKLVTGVHLRLVNTLVQKKFWWHQHFFYDVIFPQGPKFFLKNFFFFFFLQYIESKVCHKKSF